MVTIGVAAINLKNGFLNKALFLLIIPLQKKIIIIIVKSNFTVYIILLLKHVRIFIKDNLVIFK